ncbi:hypothetical protein [Nesterenkonia pannonica]|uniref:hypothetical protein n=1 Tax=Nesterenkonia pannonica TaxID=1548602 RepID=UPI0021646F44|nr:hypothetical protein [Nesterenkonia pannonica]
MEDEFLKSGEDISVRFSAPSAEHLVGSYFVSAHINNDQGVIVAQCDSRLLGAWFDPNSP